MSRNPTWEYWAHNAGNFDGLFLASAATELGWTFTATLAGSRPIRYRFRSPHARHAISVCDSFALVPSKLSAIADDFELASKKLLTDEDYSRDASTWSHHRLYTGVLADCRVLLELLERLDTLVSSWNGSLKSTFSSTALATIKANIDTPIPEISPIINDSIRSAYHGGRTEVLHHMPESTITEYDVNSSYPWSMTQPLPWEYVRGYDGRIPDTCEGVFDTIVTVPRMDIPPLPYHFKETMFFPTGTWQGWYTLPEIRYAETLGVKTKIVNGFLFKRAEPFKSIINKIYKLKQDSIGAMRQFAKLTINGVYGKFGQSPEQEKLVTLENTEDGEAYLRKNIGKVTPMNREMTAFSEESFRYAPHAHFALASYITAYSRILLHQKMISNNVSATDTDSIHATNSKIKTGKALGDWKEEGTFKALYFAPKLYCKVYEDGTFKGKAKGFPVKDFSGFCRVVRGQVVESERMRLLKTQLRKNDGKVARPMVSKQWHGLSGKRFSNPDGSTRPWTIEEIHQGRYKHAISPAFQRFSRKGSLEEWYQSCWR